MAICLVVVATESNRVASFFMAKRERQNNCIKHIESKPYQHPGKKIIPITKRQLTRRMHHCAKGLNTIATLDACLVPDLRENDVSLRTDGTTSSVAPVISTYKPEEQRSMFDNVLRNDKRIENGNSSSWGRHGDEKEKTAKTNSIPDATSTSTLTQLIPSPKGKQNTHRDEKQVSFVLPLNNDKSSEGKKAKIANYVEIGDREHKLAQENIASLSLELEESLVSPTPRTARTKYPRKMTPKKLHMTIDESFESSNTTASPFRDISNISVSDTKVATKVNKLVSSETYTPKVIGGAARKRKQELETSVKTKIQKLRQPSQVDPPGRRGSSCASMNQQPSNRKVAVALDDTVASLSSIGIDTSFGDAFPRCQPEASPCISFSAILTTILLENNKQLQPRFSKIRAVAKETRKRLFAHEDEYDPSMPLADDRLFPLAVDEDVSAVEAAAADTDTTESTAEDEGVDDVSPLDAPDEHDPNEANAEGEEVKYDASTVITSADSDPAESAAEDEEADDAVSSLTASDASDASDPRETTAEDDEVDDDFSTVDAVTDAADPVVDDEEKYDFNNFLHHRIDSDGTWRILVEWKWPGKPSSWEKLTKLIEDAPKWCANYAQKRGLLNDPAWEGLKAFVKEDTTRVAIGWRRSQRAKKVPQELAQQQKLPKCTLCGYHGCKGAMDSSKCHEAD